MSGNDSLVGARFRLRCLERWWAPITDGIAQLDLRSN